MPTPNLGGKKTHGQWVDEDGQTRAMVSGRDEDSAEAWRLMRAVGVRTPMEPVTTAHVEVKLAVRMRREGRKHVDVVINNLPCGGRFSCDRLLPVLLPDGYALNVHGPNYRKTFTGGATP